MLTALFSNSINSLTLHIPSFLWLLVYTHQHSSYISHLKNGFCFGAYLCCYTVSVVIITMFNACSWYSSNHTGWTLQARDSSSRQELPWKRCGHTRHRSSCSKKCWRFSTWTNLSLTLYLLWLRLDFLDYRYPSSIYIIFFILLLLYFLILFSSFK